MNIIRNLSEQPMFCMIISVLLFFISSMLCYLLLDGLLKMHRSKSAVKKLKKEYTSLQKLWLLPFKTHCMHAVKFCNFLIVFQRIGWMCLAVYLLIGFLYFIGLFSNLVLAWSTVGVVVLFDLPIFILHTALARPIIFGRFKHYSFEKYHNTENHNNLL